MVNSPRLCSSGPFLTRFTERFPSGPRSLEQGGEPRAVEEGKEL
jgi:hypothetical protein